MDKVEKLKAATKEASDAMQAAKTALDDATARLEAAKDLLKQLDDAAKQNIMVNDTKLPELIESRFLAQSNYDEAKARYETNLKYLTLFKGKLGLSC